MEWIEALSPIDALEPLDPLSSSDASVLLSLLRILVTFSSPSPQPTQIQDLKLSFPRVTTKLSGRGDPLVFTGDTTEVSFLLYEGRLFFSVWMDLLSDHVPTFLFSILLQTFRHRSSLLFVYTSSIE